MNSQKASTQGEEQWPSALHVCLKMAVISEYHLLLQGLGFTMYIFEILLLFIIRYWKMKNAFLKKNRYMETIMSTYRIRKTEKLE